MLIFSAVDQSFTGPSWNLNFCQNLFNSKIEELTSFSLPWVMCTYYLPLQMKGFGR